MTHVMSLCWSVVLTFITTQITERIKLQVTNPRYTAKVVNGWQLGWQSIACLLTCWLGNTYRMGLIAYPESKNLVGY